MMSSSAKAMWLATAVLGAVCAAGAVGQSSNNPGTVPPASGVPGEFSEPTRAASPAGTMSNGELKDQRKQQKKEEAAAKANAKAASAAAKSKVASDKALQAQEKAGQVVPAAAATTQAPAAPAPGTSAPPQ
jgi:hypothetical protein